MDLSKYFIAVAVLCLCLLEGMDIWQVLLYSDVALSSRTFCSGGNVLYLHFPV